MATERACKAMAMSETTPWRLFSARSPIARKAWLQRAALRLSNASANAATDQFSNVGVVDYKEEESEPSVVEHRKGFSRALMPIPLAVRPPRYRQHCVSLLLEGIEVSFSDTESESEFGSYAHPSNEKTMPYDTSSVDSDETVGSPDGHVVQVALPNTPRVDLHNERVREAAPKVRSSSLVSGKDAELARPSGTSERTGALENKNPITRHVRAKSSETRRSSHGDDQAGGRARSGSGHTRSNSAPNLTTAISKRSDRNADRSTIRVVDTSPGHTSTPSTPQSKEQAYAKVSPHLRVLTKSHGHSQGGSPRSKKPRYDQEKQTTTSPAPSPKTPHDLKVANMDTKAASSTSPKLATLRPEIRAALDEAERDSQTIRNLTLSSRSQSSSSKTAKEDLYESCRVRLDRVAKQAEEQTRDRIKSQRRNSFPPNIAGRDGRPSHKHADQSSGRVNASAKGKDPMKPLRRSESLRQRIKDLVGDTNLKRSLSLGHKSNVKPMASSLATSASSKRPAAEIVKPTPYTFVSSSKSDTKGKASRITERNHRVGAGTTSSSVQRSGGSDKRDTVVERVDGRERRREHEGAGVGRGLNQIFGATGHFRGPEVGIAHPSGKKSRVESSCVRGRHSGDMK